MTHQKLLNYVYLLYLNIIFYKTFYDFGNNIYSSLSSSSVSLMFKNQASIWIFCNWTIMLNHDYLIHLIIIMLFILQYILLCEIISMLINYHFVTHLWCRFKTKNYYTFMEIFCNNLQQKNNIPLIFTAKYVCTI